LSMRVGGVVVAAMLLGAAAPKPPATPPPFWSQKPTDAQGDAAMAAAGVKPTDAGGAMVMCRVKPDGGLEACRVAADHPAGGRFGKAALTLAPLFRVNLASPGAPAAGDEIDFGLDNYKYDAHADWLRKPTRDDLMAVYPIEASRLAKDGKAQINCLVSVQGALFDCSVMSESPPGEHFGAAALALTPQFLMKPATRKGEPVVSAINIPISFKMPAGAGPSPPSRRPDLDSKGLASPAMAWIEAPSYSALVAAYPPKAMEMHQGGRATLSCLFNRAGGLRNCATITEEPKQRGFANAALSLAKLFRGPTTIADGRSIDGVQVQIPVVFDPVMMAASPPIVGKAQWAALPSAEETSAAFGKLKLPETKDGAPARVKLACVVVQGGGVADCRVDQESPAGVGLGAAALSLAPHFKLTTWTVEGLPTVGGTVSIPLRYELKDPPPAGK
jgi:TonB family protein